MPWLVPFGGQTAPRNLLAIVHWQETQGGPYQVMPGFRREPDGSLPDSACRPIPRSAVSNRKGGYAQAPQGLRTCW